MPIGWTEYNINNCMENCNISDKAFFILTGKASGITVLDFDDINSYNKLVGKFPALLDFYTVKTNKGYHIYFLYDSTFASKTDAFSNYPKIDVLNDGKCVCSAPTIYDKLNGDTVLYEIINKNKLENIPTYLIEELKLKLKEMVQKVGNRYNLSTEEKIYIINNCFSCLCSDRCDDFDEWKKVGLIINNELGSDGYELFDEFSSNSDKYDRYEVKTFYDNIKTIEGGLTLGSLKAMAKEDDEELYLSLFKKTSIKSSKSSSKFNEYDEMKVEFEKFNFKILNPISYATITKDSNLIIRNKHDFTSVYENMNYSTICDDPKQVQFINTWLKDPTNRTYNNIDFLPKQIAPDGVYNTFTNYEVDNKELFSDIKLEDSIILEHLNNLCGNDINIFNYVVAFLARKLQQPYKLTNTSLIFKSVEGCGKDMFFNWFGSEVLGSRYYLNEDKTELIFGRFNSCIENKILIVLNEASGKDTYNLSNCIKNAISRKINNIECKGMSPFNNTNHIAYISLTNNKNPMKIDAEDRRFVGIECNNKIANNNEYFCKLNEQLTSGKYDKLFYNYLMNINVGNYDFTNNRPTSEFYDNMKESNIPVMAKFFENLIYETKSMDTEYKIKANDLFGRFQMFLKEGNFKNEITSTRFGIDIKEYEGVTKTRTKLGLTNIINFITLKKYMTSKYKMEFLEDEFIDDADSDTEEN